MGKYWTVSHVDWIQPLHLTIHSRKSFFLGVSIHNMYLLYKTVLSEHICHLYYMDTTLVSFLDSPLFATVFFLTLAHVL